MKEYKEIQACRLCKTKNLVSVLNLGEQALTGVFPLYEYLCLLY